MTFIHTMLLSCLLLLPSLVNAADLDVHGFASSSLFVPLSGFEGEADELTVGFDEAEINFESEVADGVIVRLDLNVKQVEGRNPEGPLSAVDVVEQGWARYHFSGDEDEGFFLQAGKRVAPVGVEAADPVDRYQLTNSQLAPATHSGVFAG